MAAKFLARIGGRLQEVVALVASTGPDDAGKIPQTGSDGKLDPTLIPGTNVVRATAAESITKGDFTYIDGTGKIARASAAPGGHYATGYAQANIAKDAIGEHWQEGQNTALTGLTPGGRVYLSDSTPGGVTQAPVNGAGKTHQFLGDAVSATAVAFEPEAPVVLA